MSTINGLWKTASVGSKLLGAAGALFIATVMLVMSTLAWFTISKTPEATKINVKVANTQNFEIARAKGGKDGDKPPEVTSDDLHSTDADYTWGRSISFEQSDPIEIELPAAVSGGLIQTVSFDTDSGRTAGLVNTTAPSSYTGGVGYYTYESKKCAAVMGMWLRTNTQGSIEATMTGLTITGGNGDTIRKAVSVAIKLDGQNYCTLTENSPITIGDLDASQEATYVELIVYINGEGANGVVAYDVGGTQGVNVQIDGIRFVNKSIGESTS